MDAGVGQFYSDDFDPKWVSFQPALTASPGEYGAGLGLGVTTSACLHDVFIYRLPRLTLLIPALALLRGLFPLVPQAFNTLFSPRGLAEMCVPREKNGHWSVNVTTHQYLPKASLFPLSMRQTLTWAWLFRSGDQAWHSVYPNALEGRVRFALPAIRVNAGMHGIRKHNTVYVTNVNIAALLACDAPFDFAANAPRSFVLHQRSQSLHGLANDHNKVLTTRYSIDPAVLLSDQEWIVVADIFERRPVRNQTCTVPRRTLADTLIKRMVTHAPWASSFYAPLGMNSGSWLWQTMKQDGRLQQFVDAMQRLRPEAAYLCANG